jgi:hypothetical protein
MLKCIFDNEINFYIDVLENMEDKTIKKSLIKDLKWYCKKTKNSRKLFFALTFCTISIPAVTPVVNSYFDSKIAVEIIAAINTIVSSWLAFRNYKLSWVRYGQTYEEIKREIRCELTQTGKYSEVKEEDDIEKILFDNVEKITAIENGNWVDYIMKKDDNAKAKGKKKEGTNNAGDENKNDQDPK